MPTEDAYSSGHLVLSRLGLAFVLLVGTSDTLNRLDILPVCGIITGLNILLTFHQIVVSIGHLQQVWHADRGRLLLRTPGPVPLWDLQMFFCWDQCLQNLSCFRTFEFRTSPFLLVSAQMSQFWEKLIITQAALALKDRFAPRCARIQTILDFGAFLENYEVILAKFSSSCCFMLSFSFFFVVFIFCKVGHISWCIKCH